MMENDLLSNLASSDPSAPASNGALLLLRAEMKYGFRTVDTKFEQNDLRFRKIESSLEFIAQQMSELIDQTAENSRGLKTLREEMTAGHKQLREEIAAGQAALRQEMQSLRTDLIHEIAAIRR